MRKKHRIGFDFLIEKSWLPKKKLIFVCHFDERSEEKSLNKNINLYKSIIKPY